ncbi:MAG: primosomal protein N' [Nitratiruptor sp.]|nr:primosomal protein N' [Nitratiruptor sp.]NPA83097.1 primosomal protein N' [Campylobacterota bacterium]
MSHYYQVALLSSPLTLTYESSEPIERGRLVVVPLRNRERIGVVVEEVAPPNYQTRSILQLHGNFYYSPHQLAIAAFIARYYVASMGEALNLFLPFTNYPPPPQGQPLQLPTLSQGQQQAYQAIRGHGSALLFGDTGSGKTEIYIHLFAEQLRRGRRSILLMPEISLTPQMHQRLKRHFGSLVAIWHSRLSKGERERILAAIRAGEVAIVAGPRSALFLPVADLGCIVVDEEHDDSYKSQSRPRINARDVALYMGRHLAIPVLLGSATPTPTSYAKLPTVRLTGSFHQGERHIRYDRGNGLTPPILEAIERHLRWKQQILVFTPTRGHFKYLLCQRCGEALRCPLCDVGMSLHLDRQLLLCHYCASTRPIPKVCPRCGHDAFLSERPGTKEIAQELSLHFPQATIARLDRDSVTSHKRLVEILKAFGERRIDILVGTQMVAKGHDYPDLGLSLVLGIDHILAMADFRARERAMALFVQVAGRAGRRGRGEVILQTKEEAFFQAFDDYEAFLQEELALRKGRYPPSMRLANLLFIHKDRRRAQEAMEEVLQRLGAFEVEVVGSGPAPIQRIAGRWRYHILLRSPSAKRLLEAIYGSCDGRCEVDMDPVNVV